MTCGFRPLLYTIIYVILASHINYYGKLLPSRIAQSEWLLKITALYTTEQLVVLNETSKDDRTIIRKYGRAPSGEDPFVEVSLDRGVHYSILPALTIDGYLAVCVVEGSIDGAEFYDFVVNDVVSQNRSLSESSMPF